MVLATEKLLCLFWRLSDRELREHDHIYSKDRPLGGNDNSDHGADLMNAAGRVTLAVYVTVGISLFLLVFCELLLGVPNLRANVPSLEDGGLYVGGRNIECFSNCYEPDMAHNSDIQIEANDRNYSLNLLRNYNLKLLKKIERHEILLNNSERRHNPPFQTRNLIN